MSVFLHVLPGAAMLLYVLVMVCRDHNIRYHQRFRSGCDRAQMRDRTFHSYGD